MASRDLHLDEGATAAPGVSLGVVVTEESVLRELYAPQHTGCQSGGPLTARAIPLNDLVRDGFSVHRKQHVTRKQVGDLIIERLARPRQGADWVSLGVSKLDVRCVRELRLSDEPHNQVFVVIDTGMADMPWHASIYASERDCKPSRGRKLRNLLLPVLERCRMSLDDAYKSTST